MNARYRRSVFFMISPIRLLYRLCPSRWCLSSAEELDLKHLKLLHMWMPANFMLMLTGVSNSSRFECVLLDGRFPSWISFVQEMLNSSPWFIAFNLVTIYGLMSIRNWSDRVKRVYSHGKKVALSRAAQQSSHMLSTPEMRLLHSSANAFPDLRWVA